MTFGWRMGQSLEQTALTFGADPDKGMIETKGTAGPWQRYAL